PFLIYPPIFYFSFTIQLPHRSTLFPYTTLFRSLHVSVAVVVELPQIYHDLSLELANGGVAHASQLELGFVFIVVGCSLRGATLLDRKSTRLTPVTFRYRMPSSA